MNEFDFLRLLNEYLDPPHDPNPDMADIELVWIENNPAYGALHIWSEHRISKDEVEQVLFEVPPYVEARRRSGRTVFWGATRDDRWLYIVCEDWTEQGKRYLRPITAFEPGDGVNYWERNS